MALASPFTSGSGAGFPSPQAPMNGTKTNRVRAKILANAKDCFISCLAAPIATSMAGPRSRIFRERDDPSSLECPRSRAHYDPARTSPEGPLLRSCLVQFEPPRLRPALASATMPGVRRWELTIALD